MKYKCLGPQCDFCSSTYTTNQDLSLHIAFCHIAVSHKIEHAGEDEFDLEALEEAKIRKLKMLASLKIIRKAQMIDDAGRLGLYL